MKASEKFRLLVDSPVSSIARYYFDFFLRKAETFPLENFILEVKTGKTPSKNNARFYEDQTFNWFKPNEIGFNPFLEHSENKLSKHAIDSNQVTIYKPNTILINCIGDIGRLGILKYSSSSNQQITGILLNETIMPEYAYYYLLSHRHLLADDASKTTLPIINQKKLLSIPFVLQSKNEQLKIIDLLNYSLHCFENNIMPDFTSFKFDKSFVAVCDSFFNLYLKKKDILVELTHQSTLISKLRQSILQEAVQGKLVPQNSKDEHASVLLGRIKKEKQKLIAAGKLKNEKELPPIAKEEIPFELPKGWVWCRFQDIALVDSGSTPDQKEFTQNSEDIPYLKVYNIGNQKVKFDYKPQYVRRSCHESKLRRSRCFSGNVIMNIVGPPLGKVALIPKEIPECNINQAIVVFRPYENALNKWIYNYLCEMSAINSIVTKGTAGQDNISLTQSRELLLALPPLSEQQRIVSKVEELMRTCDALEEEVESQKEKVKALMQAVLKEAFEGRKTEATRINKSAQLI